MHDVYSDMKSSQCSWLITGVAGFIGSNLLETLLEMDQIVVGLDNLSTGYQRNIDDALSSVSAKQKSNFTFIEGDICEPEACITACQGIDIVLHQAALGSVPRSIKDPLATNNTNITGFLNMLVAAKDAGIKRLVFAASSSTYGDHEVLPKVEDEIGNPLSPYAVTKLANELYAKVFSDIYGIETIGLRYFNVFGKRQDPKGAYAAVIPKWIASILSSEPVHINGDGETSRDFCYIGNAVHANLCAALTSNQQAINQVYNVAVGEKTSLNQLYQLIIEEVKQYKNIEPMPPVYREFRSGDIRHSLADISKSQNLLGFSPCHSLKAGLAEAMSWYVEHLEGEKNLGGLDETHF